MAGLRRALTLGVAGVLGAGVVALPAMAGSEATPTIEAVNEGGGIYGEKHRWSPAQATVGVDGTLTFSNPTEVRHGVEWVSGPKPSCSEGVPVGNTEAAAGTKWSGTCTFTTAGVYTFYCTVHGAAMAGTVTVGAGGEVSTTTTTSTSSAPPSTTSAAAPPTEPSAGQPLTGAGGLASPLIGSAAQAIKLRAGPGGASVRASVNLAAAGAGARLEIDLLARGSELAGFTALARVRVGHLLRSSLSAGLDAFTISLDARARHALRAHGHLLLSIVVTLTPLHGSTVRLQRSVALRHRAAS
jgi:plastocyanin